MHSGFPFGRPETAHGTMSRRRVSGHASRTLGYAGIDAWSWIMAHNRGTKEAIVPASTKKNLHVPLPEHVHTELKAQAQRIGEPATVVARRAIEERVRALKREQIADEITAYADAMAGTEFDFDPAISAAGMAVWAADEDARNEEDAAAAADAAHRSRRRASIPMRRASIPMRGDVYWATFEPRTGSEQRGRRPAVIVSHDRFNRHTRWRTLLVVPITTSTAQARRGPTAIPIPAGTAGLERASFAVCHQVTVLDRSKLGERLGRVPPDLLGEIDTGLENALDL